MTLEVLTGITSYDLKKKNNHNNNITMTQLSIL